MSRSGVAGIRLPLDGIDVETLRVLAWRAKRFARRALLGPDPPAPVRWVQIWSIGIYAGPSPCHLSPAIGVTNPVLTRDSVSDVPAQFVADPFMIEVGGTWHMFFEVMNKKTDRGEIGLATSEDGARWVYRSIVLCEPFHLSYPYVFEWDGQYFMVPESHHADAVRLYRAERFPYDWRLVAVLVKGPGLSDPSLFRFADRWWMFIETNPEPRCDTLSLYSSDSLDGGWSEHPSSPIIAGDPHVARPAGRVLVEDERVLRFAQDCHPRYGLAVTAFEILELTPHTYREQLVTPAPLFGAGGSEWNRDGMHHLDAHRRADGTWIACVDGWIPRDYASL